MDLSSWSIVMTKLFWHICYWLDPHPSPPGCILNFYVSSKSNDETQVCYRPPKSFTDSINWKRIKAPRVHIRKGRPTEFFLSSFISLRWRNALCSCVKRYVCPHELKSPCFNSLYSTVIFNRENLISWLQISGWKFSQLIHSFVYSASLEFSLVWCYII